MGDVAAPQSDAATSKLSHLKQWLSKGLTVLLILSTVLCVVLVVGSATQEDELSLFGYRLYYITTGSMEPTIPTGTLVVVKAADAYAVGDVVSYISRDTAIYGCANTHRIIAIYSDANGDVQYQTQGDANPVPDELLVPIADVIGKVVLQFSMFQWVGYLLFFVGTRWGFLLVIICPLLYVTVSNMRELVAVYKAEMHRMATAQLDHQALEEQLRQNPAAAELLKQQGILPPDTQDKEDA